MNKLAFILSVIICPSFLFGQNNELLLKNELKNAKRDSTRARLSGLLAWEIKFSKPKEALRFANEEITLARKQKSSRLMANGFRVKALILVVDEQIIKGMSCYDSAIFYARKSKDLVMEASCFSLMAGMYGDHGDFDKSIELYTKGYELAVKSKNIKTITELSNNLGDAYQLSGRNTKLAQFYFNIALKNSLKTKNYDVSAMISSNLAMEYMINQQTEKANEQLNQTIVLMNRDKTNLYRYSATIHVVASIYFKLGNLNEAKKYALTSLQLIDQLKMPDNSLRPLLVLTEIHVKNGDLLNAKYYAKILLKRAKEQNAKIYLRDANKALYEIARKSKEYEIALIHFESYKNWNDSIFKSDREKSIERVEIQSALAQNELEIKFKTAKRHSENLSLKKQNSSLRFRQVVIFSACILFGLLVTLLFFSNQKKKKTNKELEFEKKMVQQKVAENELLIHEIHHRVKNNLTMLKSLLYLQGKSSLEPETKRVLNECQARILSMSLVHQSLYEDDKMEGIDFCEFLESMFNELSVSFLPLGKDINFEVKGVKTKLGLVKGIPVALIINELVTNSLKYAFINANSGEIKVEIKSKESTTIINYMDSGPGLLNGQMSDQGGFGFKLISILTRQLNASMNYEKTLKFSVFTLEIPS